MKETSLLATASTVRKKATEHKNIAFQGEKIKVIKRENILRLRNNSKQSPAQPSVPECSTYIARKQYIHGVSLETTFQDTKGMSSVLYI